MPDASVLDVETYDNILGEVDFWINAADEPITVEKNFTFIGPDEEEVSLPMIHGYGSSTLIDGDKDVFHKSALEDVVKTSRLRMMTWRNHSFTVPDDNIGNIADKIVNGVVAERGLAVETSVRNKDLLQEVSLAYGGPDVKFDADYGIVRISS